MTLYELSDGTKVTFHRVIFKDGADEIMPNFSPIKYTNGEWKGRSLHSQLDHETQLRVKIIVEANEVEVGEYLEKFQAIGE